MSRAREGCVRLESGRLLFTVCAALAAGVGIYHLLAYRSWALYAAAAVSCSLAVAGLSWTAAMRQTLSERGAGHVVVVHATFPAVVMTLLRINQYGGRCLPGFLTEQRTIFGRFGRVPHTTTLLEEIVVVSIAAMLLGETVWLRMKYGTPAGSRAEGADSTGDPPESSVL
jgi:hypothetical protein